MSGRLQGNNEDKANILKLLQSTLISSKGGVPLDKINRKNFWNFGLIQWGSEYWAIQIFEWLKCLGLQKFVLYLNNRLDASGTPDQNCTNNS